MKRSASCLVYYGEPPLNIASQRAGHFYSIRTVARHFNLPSTTVIRLYDQLKVEGVLGSVWGANEKYIP